jgi:uncharacterized coiled-coil DUF342 family protein
MWRRHIVFPATRHAWECAREQFASLTAERDILREQLADVVRERDELRARILELVAARRIVAMKIPQRYQLNRLWNENE